MNQHPVPQNISSYEFKLVGDMTLKQFFQLAGGVVISLIIYATPLPAFIKWPLVLFFALIGVGLAFLPIEERPLSVWFLAFIKAIYSPTEYVYVQNGAEEVFAINKIALPSSPNTQQDIPIAPAPSNSQSGIVDSFEQAERGFLQKVSILFQTIHPSSLAGNPLPSDRLGASRTSPSAGSLQPDSGQTVQVLSTPSHAPIVNPIQPLPVSSQQIVTEIKPQTPTTLTVQNQIPIRVEQEIPTPASQPVKIEPIPVANVPIATPSIAPVSPQHPQAPQFVTAPATTAFSQEPANPISSAPQVPTNTPPVPVAPNTTPPAPAERPNTIVGQVITRDGHIVDGAILEIKNSAGIPVRALRSNRVGHFITVTPLADGEYEIITEKEGLEFETVKFSAEGKLIPPIEIRAKQ